MESVRGFRPVVSRSSLPEALEGFLDFAGETPVLGHNITFDYSFLKQNFANLGRNFDREGIDTLAIAKKFLPELPSRSLEALCLHYGIGQEKKHRAYEDAVSAYRLYECLGREFQSVSSGTPRFWSVSQGQRPFLFYDILSNHSSTVFVKS